MMYRSIVTTEVAVCFTTLCVLVGCQSGFALESARRVAARVCLVAVCVIAPSQTLPNVMERKHLALGKLLDVTKLVQEQFRIEARARREENSATESDGRDRRLSEHPPADAKRQPAATETCLLYTSPSPRDGLLSRMPS